MSSTLPPPPPPPGATPPPGTPPPPQGMGLVGDYLLLATESTVQVLSSTLTIDVVYSTIETSPSGVIVSLPIPATFFEVGSGSTPLGLVAGSIEKIMALPMVIAGRGQQALDANGLLKDEVTFTVEYVPPNQAGTTITAEAEVQLASFSTMDVTRATGWIQTATTIVQTVYDNLISLSGG